MTISTSLKTSSKSYIKDQLNHPKEKLYKLKDQGPAPLTKGPAAQLVKEQLHELENKLYQLKDNFDS